MSANVARQLHQSAGDYRVDQVASAPLVNQELVEEIRRLRANARAQGRRPPGRPALIAETGASEHQVRLALDYLREEPFELHSPENPNESRDVEPSAVSPALEAFTGETGAGDTSSPTQSRLEATTTADAVGGGRLVAWLGFVFGSVVSIAANVIHVWLPASFMPPGWTPGIAPQIGAAVWPIVLLISVEVLSRVQWPTGFLWGLARYAGAGTVAIGSAVISYGHLREVLLAWGYGHPGADVGPLVLDGLMVVSGFALLAMGGRSGTGSRPSNVRSDA
jgi:hypothetical protein